MTSYEKIMKLKGMPEWEFITVMLDGFADPCAGCTHKGSIMMNTKYIRPTGNATQTRSL